MAAKRHFRWPYAAIGLVIAFAIGFAVHWFAGLSLWLTVPLAIAALMINGFLAEWEDRRPGGINNPK